MRYIINDRLSLSRTPEGPLASHIRPFGSGHLSKGMCGIPCTVEFFWRRVLVNGSSSEESPLKTSARSIRRNTCDIAPVSNISPIAIRQR